MDAETKQLCEKAVQEKEDAFLISVPEVSCAPAFLQQQLVYGILARLGGAKDVTEQHVTQVLSLLEKQSGKGVDLSGGIRAERFYHILWLGRKQEETEKEERLVKIPGEYTIKEQKLSFSVFPYVNTMKIPKNRYTKWFDYDKIKDVISLRKRQQGDIIRLKSGTKTLKAFFIDEKIPKDERNQIMLVACGKEILWIPGVRSSEAYLVEEATEKILQIELKPACHSNE